MDNTESHALVVIQPSELANATTVQEAPVTANTIDDSAIVNELLAPINDEEVLKHKASLIELMSHRCVDLVVLEYSGSGDSGNINEVSMYRILEEESLTSENRQHEVQDAEIHEAMICLADALIDSREFGYEDNAGGGGTITVQNGLVEWDHAQDYLETYHRSYRA